MKFNLNLFTGMIKSKSICRSVWKLRQDGPKDCSGRNYSYVLTVEASFGFSATAICLDFLGNFLLTEFTLDSVFVLPQKQKSVFASDTRSVEFNTLEVAEHT